MVVVLAFHSDDPSSNLAEVVSVKFVVEKNENKQKKAGVGPFKKHWKFAKQPGYLQN